MKDTYTIKDLRKDFPDDDTCLDFIFNALHSKECSCGGEYNRISGRKQYQCSKCRFQIAPTAGTIFHKSRTPLTDWFYALFIFSNAKSGISAKELQRQLGVTYKTAWRMLSQIRKALKQDDTKLKGIVEVDSAYFGGRRYAGKNNENQSHAIRAKSVVFAAAERGGDIRAKVMPDSKAASHEVFLYNNVKLGSRLMSDNTNRMKRAGQFYERERVTHKRGEYARGDVHVNAIERFWSHAKTSIRGTYKVVSKQHLQEYLDGFVWHYNNRHSDSDRFASLLGAVLLGAK